MMLRTRWPLLAFLAVVAALPLLPVPEFWITQLNYIGLYALVALGLVLGANLLGTLLVAYLTEGGWIGAPEQRARIAGRLLAPEAAGDPGAATNAGSCVDASAAFALDLRAERGTASAVIAEQDTSAAGRRLSQHVPGAEDGSTDWPGGTPLSGDALRFDAASMPLGLPPERIEARAHSLWLEAEFDELRFSPRELSGGLTYSPHP